MPRHARHCDGILYCDCGRSVAVDSPLKDRPPRCPLALTQAERTLVIDLATKRTYQVAIRDDLDGKRVWTPWGRAYRKDMLTRLSRKQVRKGAWGPGGPALQALCGGGWSLTADAIQIAPDLYNWGLAMLAHLRRRAPSE